MRCEENSTIMQAPKIKRLPMFYCSRYAVLSVRHLTGSNYAPADTWELGKKNKIIKILNKKSNIIESLEDYVNIMLPGETIVVFYNPKSLFNRPWRIGTHCAVYLGKNSDLIFAEQYFIRQRSISYFKMIKKGLFPKQILGPKNS